MSEEKIDRLEKEVNNIKVALANLGTSLEYLKETMSEMKRDIDTILERVMTWNGRMAREYTSKVETKEIMDIVDRNSERIGELEASVGMLEGRINTMKWAIGIWAGVITTVIGAILYYLFGR